MKSSRTCPNWPRSNSLVGGTVYITKYILSPTFSNVSQETHFLHSELILLNVLWFSNSKSVAVLLLLIVLPIPLLSTNNALYENAFVTMSRRSWNFLEIETPLVCFWHPCTSIPQNNENGICPSSFHFECPSTKNIWPQNHDTLP